MTAYVAGPHDNQSGLTDWVRAAVRGGRFELPGDPAQPVQLVDSRDLARLVVTLLTDDRGGAHTAAGLTTTLAGLMAVCAAAAGTSVERSRFRAVVVEPRPSSRRDCARR